MKAFILAAGLGTRLLPYTRIIPKPLFTLLSKPMLGHCIDQLADAGCTEIVINTHHLHDQIAHYIGTHPLGRSIEIIHEPNILDTGGAIANAASFFTDTPFFVINADIIFNVNLEKLYQFHLDAHCTATLVLHDHKVFNTVGVNPQGYIENFNSPDSGLAFTGVHVLSPDIFDYFPSIDHHTRGPEKFSIIETYKQLCPLKKINALIETDLFWADIGTPTAYSNTSMLMLAARQFSLPKQNINKIKIEKLAGDGSDRQWYRAGCDDKSVIVSDHGVCLPGSDNDKQCNAFIHIGKHLAEQLVPKMVPTIFDSDRLSGMVILEDLGDTHLEAAVRSKNSHDAVIDMYQQVIDRLIEFSQAGVTEFNETWTCQTPTYSRKLMLENECRYFIREFINGYLGLKGSFDDYLAEFNTIADIVLENQFKGLMHRDMQSRNIMIRKTQIYFIDFQGARKGPLQYDLASLLIDPYVELSFDIQKELLQYTMDKLGLNPKAQQQFSMGYQYCCLTRNMQFLGAFAFLSQKKQKKKFEQYIPYSVKLLKQQLNRLDGKKKYPRLSTLIKTVNVSKTT